jgi:hypothetical protein
MKPQYEQSNAWQLIYDADVTELTTNTPLVDFKSLALERLAHILGPLFPREASFGNIK